MIDKETVNLSEALECLERLEYYHTKSVRDLDCKEHRLKDIETIKQALLKSEKELKALDIIKEKRANTGTFYHVDTKKEFLTLEEFNLLKEVLE